MSFSDVSFDPQIIPARRQYKCGYETIGIVRRVGPKTAEFAVTDRVVFKGAGKIMTVIAI